MSQEPTKTCPECGGEYAPHGQVCADCGKALVFKKEGAETPTAPLAEDDEGVCLREGRIGYLRELSDLLAKNRISNSVRLHGAITGGCSGGTVYGLYVSSDDVETAKEIDRVHWLQGAPEHAASYRYSEQELAGTCPACNTALPKGAGECPECGLSVGTIETAECPACETDVPEDSEVCPNCGAEFE